MGGDNEPPIPSTSKGTPTVRPIKCGLCPNTFRYNKQLNIHVMKRHGENSKAAEKSEGSPSAGQVTPKSRGIFGIHGPSARTPIKCTACPKEFLYRVQLKNHIAECHRVKPTGPNFDFTDASTLSMLRGGVWSSCIICDCIFDDRAELTEHIVRHTTRDLVESKEEPPAELQCKHCTRSNMTAREYFIHKHIECGRRGSFVHQHRLEADYDVSHRFALRMETLKNRMMCGNSAKRLPKYRSRSTPPCEIEFDNETWQRDSEAMRKEEIREALNSSQLINDPYELLYPPIPSRTTSKCEIKRKYQYPEGFDKTEPERKIYFAESPTQTESKKRSPKKTTEAKGEMSYRSRSPLKTPRSEKPRKERRSESPGKINNGTERKSRPTERSENGEEQRRRSSPSPVRATRTKRLRSKSPDRDAGSQGNRKGSSSAKTAYSEQSAHNSRSSSQSAPTEVSVVKTCCCKPKTTERTDGKTKKSEVQKKTSKKSKRSSSEGQKRSPCVCRLCGRVKTRKKRIHSITSDNDQESQNESTAGPSGRAEEEQRQKELNNKEQLEKEKRKKERLDQERRDKEMREKEQLQRKQRAREQREVEQRNEEQRIEEQREVEQRQEQPQPGPSTAAEAESNTQEEEEEEAGGELQPVKTYNLRKRGRKASKFSRYWDLCDRSYKCSQCKGYFLKTQRAFDATFNQEEWIEHEVNHFCFFNRDDKIKPILESRFNPEKVLTGASYFNDLQCRLCPTKFNMILRDTDELKRHYTYAHSFAYIVTLLNKEARKRTQEDIQLPWECIYCKDVCEIKIFPLMSDLVLHVSIKHEKLFWALLNHPIFNLKLVLNDMFPALWREHGAKSHQYVWRKEKDSDTAPPFIIEAMNYLQKQDAEDDMDYVEDDKDPESEPGPSGLQRANTTEQLRSRSPSWDRRSSSSEAGPSGLQTNRRDDMETGPSGLQINRRVDAVDRNQVRSRSPEPALRIHHIDTASLDHMSTNEMTEIGGVSGVRRDSGVSSASSSSSDSRVRSDISISSDSVLNTDARGQASNTESPTEGNAAETSGLGGSDSTSSDEFSWWRNELLPVLQCFSDSDAETVELNEQPDAGEIADTTGDADAANSTDAADSTDATDVANPTADADEVDALVPAQKCLSPDDLLPRTQYMTAPWVDYMKFLSDNARLLVFGSNAHDIVTYIKGLLPDSAKDDVVSVGRDDFLNASVDSLREHVEAVPKSKKVIVVFVGAHGSLVMPTPGRQPDGHIPLPPTNDPPATELKKIEDKYAEVYEGLRHAVHQFFILDPLPRYGGYPPCCPQHFSYRRYITRLRILNGNIHMRLGDIRILPYYNYLQLIMFDLDPNALPMYNPLDTEDDLNDSMPPRPLSGGVDESFFKNLLPFVVAEDGVQYTELALDSTAQILTFWIIKENPGWL